MAGSCAHQSALKGKTKYHCLPCTRYSLHALTSCQHAAPSRLLNLFSQSTAPFAVESTTSAEGNNFLSLCDLRWNLLIQLITLNKKSLDIDGNVLKFRNQLMEGSGRKLALWPHRLWCAQKSIHFEFIDTPMRCDFCDFPILTAAKTSQGRNTSLIHRDSFVSLF